VVKEKEGEKGRVGEEENKSVQSVVKKDEELIQS
jgi:hypothetical protein